MPRASMTIASALLFALLFNGCGARIIGLRGLSLTNLSTRPIELVSAESIHLSAASSAFSGYADPSWDPAITQFNRSGFTLTPIRMTPSASDRLLVAIGGDDAGAPTSQTVIYAPETNAWTKSILDPVKRSGHSANLISYGADGHEAILVAGGCNTYANPLTMSRSTEVFDPSGGGVGVPAWISVAPIGAARQGQIAVTLSDGRVFVAGGSRDCYSRATYGLDSAEIYDPSVDAWSSVASLPEVRTSARGALVQVGPDRHDAVLVVGGWNDGGAVSDVVLYDVPTDSWLSVGSMGYSASNLGAVNLPDGRVWFGGGMDTSWVKYNRSRIFTPNTTASYPTAPGTISTVASIPSTLFNFSYAQAKDGSVLVDGGVQGSTASAKLYRYDPGADTWSTVTTHQITRYAHEMTVLDDGRILVYGGGQQWTVTDSTTVTEWVYTYPIQDPPVVSGGIAPYTYRLVSGTGYLYADGRYVPNQNTPEIAEIEAVDSIGSSVSYTVETTP